MAELASTISSCTFSSDSCDGLEGRITHSVTEITGIKSASVFKRNSNSSVIEAVDQFNGAEFSNLIIEIELSWIEEQHRFRAPATFNQSLLSWFISPAVACTLAPYYEDFQPAVTSVEVYSDNDLNGDFVAGSDLTNVFAATGMMGGNSTLLEAAENNGLLSARSYSLQSEWQDGVLATTPVIPKAHIFTIMITLDNGRAFEIRTPDVLLSGV